MQQESIAFIAPDGASKPAVAEVVRYSSTYRYIMASLYVVGGLVGATVCIVVFIVHLITTWALPLLGIYMAYRTINRQVAVYDAKGVCPACNEPIELMGGAIENRTWQTCPLCHTQLTISIPALESAASEPSSESH